MPSVPRSYIISQYKVSKTTHDLVHAKLVGLDPEHRRFFLHILCSQLLELRKGTVEVVPGWDTLGINLPFVTIKAEFPRGFSWKPLAERKLLTASDYATGECRYFQVAEPVLAEILSHIEAQNASPDGSPAVNLFDGTAFNVAWSMSNTEAARSSKLMRDAARVLHTVDCPFDIAAVQEHLVQLKASGKTAAYENDRLCAHTLMAGSRREGTLGFYIPSYAPQSSGRIGELGGGLQSCSKAMKHAAFLGVDNIFNYDLRSSQGYVLLQELQLAGIDAIWLEDHLGPGIFEQRASALGLSKGSYKKCFFSTIMGATHWWVEQGARRRRSGNHLGRLCR